jgi:hypothetical protein
MSNNNNSSSNDGVGYSDHSNNDCQICLFNADTFCYNICIHKISLGVNNYS